MATYGYLPARCPGDGGLLCALDCSWGHPCPRDEDGEYECESQLPCPEAAVCQHCRCAVEDDVCFPAERVDAERFFRNDFPFGHRQGAVLVTCPACGAWVGSRDGGATWRCDDGHVVITR